MDTRTPSPSRVEFRICCVEREGDLRKWRMFTTENQMVRFSAHGQINCQLRRMVNFDRIRWSDSVHMVRLIANCDEWRIATESDGQIQCTWSD